jgi:hypothetical protein
VIFGVVAAGWVPPLWAAGGYLAAILVVGLGEGAYRAWNETDEVRVALEAQRAIAANTANAMQDLGQTCLTLAGELSEFAGCYPPIAASRSSTGHAPPATGPGRPQARATRDAAALARTFDWPKRQARVGR